jgi:hypothetical protein
MPPHPPRIPRPQPPRPGRMPRTIRPPQMGFTMPRAATQGALAVDFGQAIAEQLLAGFQQIGQDPVVIELPAVAPEHDQGVDVRPTIGSVLHFTPDSRGWLAQLSNEDGDSWDEPVVGWAVVCTWVSYAPEADDAEPRPEGDESEFQTEIQPALFTDNGVELMIFRDGVTLDGLVMPGLPGPPSNASR